MNYHIPKRQSRTPVPKFAVKNGMLVCPEKIYSQQDYPSLPSDMVKITAQNGKKIYIPREKLSSAEV
jgi:hypothetical protein